MKRKINIIIGYTISICAILLGFTILLSILYSTPNYLINIVTSIPILAYGFVYFLRVRQLTKIEAESQMLRYLSHDTVIQLFTLAFFCLLLAMAIYRVVSEKTSIFG